MRNIAQTDAAISSPRTGIALLIIGLGLLVVLIVSAATIPFPVQVTAAVTLQPAEPVVPIQSPVSGKLQSFHARAGWRVRAGEVLAVIEDPVRAGLVAERRELANAARASLASAEVDVERARAAAERNESVHLVAEAGLQREIARHASALSTARQSLNRTRELFRQGIASRELLDQREAEAAHMEALFDAAVNTLERASTRRQAERAEESHALQIANDALAARRSLSAAEDTRFYRSEAVANADVIRSPAEGLLTHAAELTRGAYVRQGSTIAELRTTEALEAHAIFSDSVVGRLRPGQRATIRLTARPWLWHGSVRAWVHAVDYQKNGIVTAHLRIRESEGLMAGMSGSVAVVVEKKTILRTVVEHTTR